MTRRREVGTLKLGILSAALITGLALPAQAQDNKLDLSANVAITTDYIFRGISQSDENPAIQGGFDAAYGIFYAGIWASNVDFGGTADNAPLGTDIANLEIDYYLGIAPTWKGFSFDIAGLYYTYPGAHDPGAELDYFELKTGISYTFAERLTVGVTNYWSPEFGGELGDADALELGVEYAFGGKLFNYFSPSISGGYGYQWIDLGTDYAYWNAGLTLGFLENWSADLRYWDTDLGLSSSGLFADDARVVGTIKASF